MSYRPCASLQRHLLEAVAEGAEPDTLLLVEHDPVLTLGAGFHAQNLLLTADQYREREIEVEVTDRGGDVTYHGPNQLVAYPIFHLALVEKDIHRWLRMLEESVIAALREFGLEGGRFPPNTGVWVGGRKICAIGVKVRRWVSMHGIALNCDNDLGPFQLIVPCGIREHGVTSISRELGRTIGTAEAASSLRRALEATFAICLEEVSRKDLEERLSVRS